MVDTLPQYRLNARDALPGFVCTVGDTTLRAIADLRIISLAVPADRQTAFERAIQTSYHMAAPRIGHAAVTPDQGIRLIGAAAEHYLLLGAAEDLPLHAVSALGDTALLTDQSDNWVILSLSGTLSRYVLSRFCMLDLHPDVFLLYQYASTRIEHITAHIMRIGENHYTIQSPRSSAESLAHALENALKLVS